MTEHTTTAIFSAARIAELMAATPEQAKLPTPEQTHVIEQPLAGSVLVIAGAGSGKTETMANRVVWLVANGFATPSQVLGLTFTRKAAGELGERIVERLQRFTDRLGDEAISSSLTPVERDRAEALQTFMAEGLELPDVSTYNSFASSVVQEFGATAGVSATATVIDASTAWGIARQVVRTSQDDELAESTDSIDVLVKQVITLDHAVADNLTSFDEVLRCVAHLERISALPYNSKKSDGQYSDITRVLEHMRATRLTVTLAERFAAEKRRRGLIEFSDQLLLAVETLRKFSGATRAIRQRTPIVLLDEVQDTSVGQTELLSTLFAGLPVMAVGDPHQSIYAFRGASASNMQTFHQDFSGSTHTKRTGTTLSLSTSWRNPGPVLRAANIVSAPLAAKLHAETADLSVQPLTSRSHYLGRDEPTEPISLETVVEQTIEQEFERVGEWLRSAQNEHLTRTGDKPTAAVVFRSRKHMAAMSEALWAAGVPNRIVGIGGLLTTPEITDLVCVLRCLWYADASNELLRLLAGPRFRIGVADLRGLQQAAQWFSLRDHTKQPLTEDDLAAMPRLSDPERNFTLLDALDEIATMPNLNHGALRNVTETGRTRLLEAGQLLRSLRQQVGGDVPALLHSAVQALRLDIELDAAEHTGNVGSAAARANLDLFTELVEDFLATDEDATLDSLLAWLERAAIDDEAAEHLPPPEPGAVQLITVHGSKGLEWDLVVVPRLVDGEFPSGAREGLGWLRRGQLPDELRGDARARPKLDLSLDSTQKEVLESIAAYQDELRQRHADEERRLAYVAMTRAASRLLLTCSFWGGQERPRPPAVYLKDIEAAGLIDALPLESEYETRPNHQLDRTLLWPLDPLGRRKTTVSAAADALNAHLEQTPADEPSLHPVVELLLAEQAAELESGQTRDGSAGHEQQPVERLTASTFHEFVENPVEAERRRLRPLPIRPYRRTRTGNLFHEWVERRVGTAIGTAQQLDFAGLDSADFDALGDTPVGDALAGGVAIGDGRVVAEVALQPEEPHEELDLLIEQFERSRWADLKPIAVELEISMPFAGRTIVCKLDAVYRTAPTASNPAASEERYEIVDWKSGTPPTNEQERASRFLQLDLYRHAYARHTGIDPELIDVTLFYVAEGMELRSQSPRTFAELEQLWLEARRSLTG